MKCPNCKKIFMEYLKTRILPDGTQHAFYVCNNCNTSYSIKEKYYKTKILDKKEEK